MEEKLYIAGMLLQRIGFKTKQLHQETDTPGISARKGDDIIVNIYQEKKVLIVHCTVKEKLKKKPRGMVIFTNKRFQKPADILKTVKQAMKMAGH